MTAELESAKRLLEGAPPPALAAVSGGKDSMCLLHLLSTWGRARGMAFTAAHFNHQLRFAESDQDEAFVRDWCAAHDVPFVAGRGDVGALAAEAGLSVEEAARQARYAFLEEAARQAGCACILTAHHADDSAETLLLNLLRGTGARGLAGIPETRGNILRPFLRVTRRELDGYAARHAVPHVEDGTNADPDAAARNLIRLRVMPLLKELNPRAVENMARTAELLAKDEEALARAAGEVLRHALVEPGVEAVLPLSACACAPEAVVSRAVRRLLAAVGGHEKDLTARHIEAVYGLLRSAPGREVSLPYAMTARREAAALAVRRAGAPPEEQAIAVGESRAFGRWRVELSAEGGDMALSLPPGAALTVTAWRRDDRMTLPGSRGARSFKRLCAERGISPIRRDTLPVLRADGKIAAAPGVGVDTAFAPGGARGTAFATFKKIEEKTYEE